MYFVAPFGHIYAVYDENRVRVAVVDQLDDAEKIAAALNLVEAACLAFPGIEDGETPVNGGDLVDLFNASLEFDTSRDPARYKWKGGG